MAADGKPEAKAAPKTAAVQPDGIELIEGDAKPPAKPEVMRNRENSSAAIRKRLTWTAPNQKPAGSGHAGSSTRARKRSTWAAPNEKHVELDDAWAAPKEKHVELDDAYRSRRESNFMMTNPQEMGALETL